jgi:hypothetical protein
LKWQSKLNATFKQLNTMRELIAIQAELKAPKNQYNSFGKYKYRSVEDILEAVKPLLVKYECTLTIEDEVKEVGGIVFIEATASIQVDKIERMEGRAVTAQAGIDINRKGMDIAQSFGSSSSYARKYALNGLFLIDDTKDPDSTNDHAPKVSAVTKTKPTDEQFAYIVRYLNGTDAQQKQAKEALNKYELTQDQQDTLNGLL